MPFACAHKGASGIKPKRAKAPIMRETYFMGIAPFCQVIRPLRRNLAKCVTAGAAESTLLPLFAVRHISKRPLLASVLYHGEDNALPHEFILCLNMRTSFGRRQFSRSG